MDKTALRDALMEQLRRMNKLNVMRYLREFAEGETAVLDCLFHHSDKPTPSSISEELNLSRTRTANILSALRKKGLIVMEMASEDRRKMYVTVTEEGGELLKEKYFFLAEYLGEYVEVLGEEKISSLTALLKLTADSEKVLFEKFSRLQGRLGEDGVHD